MQLTRAERAILANQYEILEHIRPEQAATYRNYQQALRCGYEREYNDALNGLYPESEGLDQAQCEEVVGILHFFRVLRQSPAWTSMTAGHREALDFRGFDGNEEGQQHGYALFLREDRRRFTEFPGGESFNSHTPMLPAYRAMMKEWRTRGSRHQDLTAEDLDAIARASGYVRE